MQVAVREFPGFAHALSLYSAFVNCCLTSRFGMQWPAENCQTITVNMWISKVTCIPFAAGYTPLSTVGLFTREGGELWCSHLVKVNNVTVARGRENTIGECQERITVRIVFS
jgi:hypothetical protein